MTRKRNYRTCADAKQCRDAAQTNVPRSGKRVPVVPVCTPYFKLIFGYIRADNYKLFRLNCPTLFPPVS